MTDYLFCKVCHDKYDIYSKKPLTLPCGHTFCEYCIKIILQNKKIICPLDKKSCLCEDFTLIPFNYQLLDSFLVKNSEFSINIQDNFCKIHENEILKFYCLAEKQKICQICILKDHMSHFKNIIPLNDIIFVSEINSKLAQVKEKNQKNIEKNENMIENLKNNRKNNLEKLETIKKKIKTSMESHINYLNNSINSKFESEKSYFTQKSDLLTKKSDEIIQNINLLNDPQCNLENISNFFDQEFDFSLKTNEKQDFSNLFYSKEFIENILSVQIPNFSLKNYKNLLKIKPSLSNNLFSGFLKVNRLNYLKNEDITKAFEDKNFKLDFNGILFSQKHLIKLFEEIKPWNNESLNILEIGNSNGYLAAIFAEITDEKTKIYSLENNLEAKKNSVNKIKMHNEEVLNKITLVNEEEIKEIYFDIIVVGSLVSNIPIEWENKLEKNGKMWICVGTNRNYTCYIIEKDKNLIVRTRKIFSENNEMLNNSDFQFIQLF